MKPRTRVEKEIGRMKTELFLAYYENYMLITKRRLKLFEKDGTIGLTDDGSTRHSDGRRWLAVHLKYFEKRDEPVFYKICSDIKKVLDEYDSKFKTGGEVLNQEDFSSFEID